MNRRNGGRELGAFQDPPPARPARARNCARRRRPLGPQADAGAGPGQGDLGVDRAHRLQIDGKARAPGAGSASEAAPRAAVATDLELRYRTPCGVENGSSNIQRRTIRIGRSSDRAETPAGTRPDAAPGAPELRSISVSRRRPAMLLARRPAVRLGRTGRLGRWLAHREGAAEAALAVFFAGVAGWLEAVAMPARPDRARRIAGSQQTSASAGSAHHPDRPKPVAGRPRPPRFGRRRSRPSRARLPGRALAERSRSGLEQVAAGGIVSRLDASPGRSGQWTAQARR